MNKSHNYSTMQQSIKVRCFDIAEDGGDVHNLQLNK